METNGQITLDSVKSILLSKTFWFNAIVGLVALCAELNSEMLTSFGIPVNMQTTILHLTGVITALVNIALRMRTSSAVAMKVPKISTDKE